MSDRPVPTFQCPHCRRRFAWKPALAGTPLRCTCGQVFAVGAQPMASAASHPLSNDPVAASDAIEPGTTGEPEAAGELEDPFATPAPAPAGPGVQPGDFDDPRIEESPDDSDLMVHCPSCNLPMKASAKVCLNCGFNVDVGRKVKTKVLEPLEPPRLSRPLTGTPVPPPPGAPTAPGATQENSGRDANSSAGPPSNVRQLRPSGVIQALQRREDEATASAFLDLYLPLALIAAGLPLMFWAGRLIELTDRAILTGMGLYVATMVPLMLGVLFLVAHYYQANFGPLGRGLFKLTSIAIGPMALADLLGAYIILQTLGYGQMFVWFMRVVFVGVPLSYMFDLDWLETIITLGLILFARVLFQFVVVDLLLPSLL